MMVDAVARLRAENDELRGRMEALTRRIVEAGEVLSAAPANDYIARAYYQLYEALREAGYDELGTGGVFGSARRALEGEDRDD